MRSLLHAIVFVSASTACSYLLSGCYGPTLTAMAITGYAKGQHAVANAVDARKQLSRREIETRPKSEPSTGGLRAIDIRKTCQTSADISGHAFDQRAYDSCLRDELAARDAIVKQWKDFLPPDKASCIKPDVYLPSYIEWLTCLELHRDVRKLRGPA